MQYSHHLLEFNFFQIVILEFWEMFFRKITGIQFSKKSAISYTINAQDLKILFILLT